MRKIAFIMVLLLSAVSCQRRELEDPYDIYAIIPISINWSGADLDPDNDPNQDVYGATVWFFPKDGSNNGRPIEKRLANPRGGEVIVPVGHYSILIHNNTLQDYSTIEFKGTDTYETFEAHAVTDTKSDNSRVEGNNKLTKEPEILAAWSLDDCEVTIDMAEYTRSKATKGTTKSVATKGVTKSDPANSLLDLLQEVRPLRMVSTMGVVAHVQNLNNARSSSGMLVGMAGGVNLSTGKALLPQTDHIFTLNNRTYYAGSTKDGTVEAELVTFGLLEEDGIKYGLKIDFVLANDTPSDTFEFDITNMIKKHTTKSTKLDLEVEIGLSNDGGDRIIRLPEYSTEGFGITLDEWSEELPIPVSM